MLNGASRWRCWLRCIYILFCTNIRLNDAFITLETFCSDTLAAPHRSPEGHRSAISHLHWTVYTRYATLYGCAYYHKSALLYKHCISGSFTHMFRLWRARHTLQYLSWCLHYVNWTISQPAGLESADYCSLPGIDITILLIMYTHNVIDADE